MAEQKWLYVNNWDKWQATRKDARRQLTYFRIYTQLADDLSFQEMTFAEKGMLLQAFILAAKYDGRVPIRGNIVEKVGNHAESIDLNRLIELGFLGKKRKALEEKRREEKRREERARVDDDFKTGSQGAPNPAPVTIDADKKPALGMIAILDDEIVRVYGEQARRKRQNSTDYVNANNILELTTDEGIVRSIINSVQKKRKEAGDEPIRSLAYFVPVVRQTLADGKVTRMTPAGREHIPAPKLGSLMIETPKGNFVTLYPEEHLIYKMEHLCVEKLWMTQEEFDQILERMREKVRVADGETAKTTNG